MLHELKAPAFFSIEKENEDSNTAVEWHYGLQTVASQVLTGTLQLRFTPITFV